MEDHASVEQGYIRAHIDPGEQGAFDAGAYSFFGDMAPLDEGLGGALEDGLEAPPEELPGGGGAFENEEDIAIEDLMSTDEDEDLSLAGLLRRKQEEGDSQHAANGMRDRVTSTSAHAQEQSLMPPLPPQPGLLGSLSQQQQQQHVATPPPQRQPAAAVAVTPVAEPPSLPSIAALDTVVPPPSSRPMLPLPAQQVTPSSARGLSNAMTAEELEARMLRSADGPPSDARGTQLLSMLKSSGTPVPEQQQQHRHAPALQEQDPAVLEAQLQMQHVRINSMSAPALPPHPGAPLPEPVPGFSFHQQQQQQQHHFQPGALPPHSLGPVPPPAAFEQMQMQQQPPYMLPGQPPPPFMGLPPPPHHLGDPMAPPAGPGPAGLIPPMDPHRLPPPQPGMGGPDMTHMRPPAMPHGMMPPPPHHQQQQQQLGPMMPPAAAMHPGAVHAAELEARHPVPYGMPPGGGGFSPHLGPGMMPPGGLGPAGGMDMQQQQQQQGGMMQGMGPPPLPGHLLPSEQRHPSPGTPLQQQQHQQQLLPGAHPGMPPAGFTTPMSAGRGADNIPGVGPETPAVPLMPFAGHVTPQSQIRTASRLPHSSPAQRQGGPRVPQHPQVQLTPPKQQQQAAAAADFGIGGGSEYMVTASTVPADAARTVSPAALVHKLRSHGSSWMAADDINYILRIQHMATHSGVPYMEDFYFQAFCNKYFGGRNTLVFAPQQLRELGPELHSDVEPRFADLAGLGRVVLSNIRTPKMLMDVGGGGREAKGPFASGEPQQHDQDSSEASKARPLEQEPMLAARIMVEDCMVLLCDVEDIDRMSAAAAAAAAAHAAGAHLGPHTPGPISPALTQKLLQRRAALLGGIAASFRLPDAPTLPGDAASGSDGVFVRILALPKGRSLINKTLKLMFTTPAGGPKGGAAGAAAVMNGSSNGSSGSTASSMGLDLIWALLRNAKLAFGPALVGSIGEAEKRLTDATIALAGSTAEMVKRLQKPEEAVACLAAAVAGLSAPGVASDSSAASTCQLLPLFPAGRVQPSANPDWLGNILAALLLRASELGLGSFAAAAAAGPARGLGDGAPDEAELQEQQAQANGVHSAVATEWQALLGRLFHLVQLHLWQLVQAVRGAAPEVAASAGSASESSTQVLLSCVPKLACVPLMRLLMAHCDDEQQEQLKGYLSEVGR